MNQLEENISIFVGVVFILVNFFGLPVNIMALVVLKKQAPGAPRLIDKIPISMCISNLIQMFPIYTITAVACLKAKWIFGMPLCYFMGFWVHTNANAAIWHLVLYAVEQKRALCSGYCINAAKRHMCRWKQYGALALVWGHGVFWSTVPFAGWAEYQFEGLNVSCSVAWEKTDPVSLSYTTCILLFNFVIPVTVIGYCYTKIFRGFKTHVKTVSASVGMAAQQSNRLRLRRLAAIGSFMTASFLFAWAPYAIVATITIITQKTVSPIAATLPAVFGKCSVLIYPTIIVWKRTTLKFRLPENSKQQASNLPSQKVSVRELPNS
eukprot:gene13976-4939_t